MHHAHTRTHFVCARSARGVRRAHITAAALTYNVFLVGLQSDATGDLLPPPDGQVVLQVEHRLLPVGVRRVWSWGDKTPHTVFVCVY